MSLMLSTLTLKPFNLFSDNSLHLHKPSNYKEYIRFDYLVGDNKKTFWISWIRLYLEQPRKAFVKFHDSSIYIIFHVIYDYNFKSMTMITQIGWGWWYTISKTLFVIIDIGCSKCGRTYPMEKDRWSCCWRQSA